MLFETLDRIKRSIIMVAITLMFVGCTLALTPEHYMTFLGSAIGFVLAVFCVTSMLRFWESVGTLMDCIRLTIGLVAGAFSVALFVFDGLFEWVIALLVGTVPIITGIYGLYHAFTYARRSGRRGWWVLVVLTGSLVLFGAFVFLNPWSDDPQVNLRVVGGTLMYSAIVSALSLIWIWPVRTEEEE
jgi:hypothetical protein